MEQIRPDRHTEDHLAKSSEVRRLAEYEQVRIKRANKVTTEILGLLGLLRSVGETVGRYYGKGEKTANPEPIKLIDETKTERKTDFELAQQIIVEQFGEENVETKENQADIKFTE